MREDQRWLKILRMRRRWYEREAIWAEVQGYREHSWWAKQQVEQINRRIEAMGGSTSSTGS